MFVKKSGPLKFKGHRLQCLILKTGVGVDLFLSLCMQGLPNVCCNKRIVTNCSWLLNIFWSMPCYENFRNIYSKLHQSKYNRVTGNKFYVLLYRENGLKSNIPELL